MKHIIVESSSGGSVALASKAYRSVLAQHGLVDFSAQEIKGALDTLQSEGSSHVGSRDIRFQAALTRLSSRKDLSPPVIQGILRELVDCEYELDQAEWERDCHREVSLSHSNYRAVPFQAPQYPSAAKA